jgi:hypothetical protein
LRSYLGKKHMPPPSKKKGGAGIVAHGEGDDVGQLNCNKEKIF